MSKLPVEYAYDLWNAIRNEDRPELIMHQMKITIRQAMLDEREACAQIADHVASPQELGEYTYGSIASERIAAAIRARGVADSTQEISPKTPDQGA